MSQIFRSGCFISKSGGHSLDSEEYIEKGSNLLSWKMPSVPTSKIYRRKGFSFSSDRSIKTKEVKISCGNGSGAFGLITENPTMNVLKDRRFYSMFNVGMVQIGVKTLTRKIPSNASIVLCVRDSRREKLEDSFLGMVESNLSDGPFYFNIFPNITMSSFDPKLYGALILDVIVDGFEHLPAGSKPISVIFRTCSKLQNGPGPDALLESPDGKTVFFQTDLQESNVAVQKVTKWDEVIQKLVYSTDEEKASQGNR